MKIRADKMKSKLIFLMVLIFCWLPIFSQNNIYGIINREIILHDSFAGQSITLVMENNNYYIYRKIFGSGVPIIGSIKYAVIFNSEYKITFSEIVSISENLDEWNNRNEIFEIYSTNEIIIYLNGIRLYINRIEI